MTYFCPHFFFAHTELTNTHRVITKATCRQFVQTDFCPHKTSPYTSYTSYPYPWSHTHYTLGHMHRRFHCTFVFILRGTENSFSFVVEAAKRKSGCGICRSSLFVWLWFSLFWRSADFKDLMSLYRVLAAYSHVRTEPLVRHRPHSRKKKRPNDIRQKETTRAGKKAERVKRPGSQEALDGKRQKQIKGPRTHS